MLLGKIKLYDIAKELNLTSKEVLEIAKKLNIDAKSHLSSVDEGEAQKIKESIKNSKNKKEEKKLSNEKPKAEKNDTPVVREVLYKASLDIMPEDITFQKEIEVVFLAN